MGDYSTAGDKRKEASKKLHECVRLMKESNDLLDEIFDNPDFGFNGYGDKFKKTLHDAYKDIHVMRTNIRRIATDIE